MDIAPRPRQEKLPLWVGVGGNTCLPASPAPDGSASRCSSPCCPARSASAAWPRCTARAPTKQGTMPEPCRWAWAATSTPRPPRSRRGTRLYPPYRGYFEQNMPRNVDHFPRSTFDDWSDPGGGLLVGSPQQIIEKLLGHPANARQHPLHGPGRPRRPALRRNCWSIELLATEIMPAVNRELGASAALSATCARCGGSAVALVLPGLRCSSCVGLHQPCVSPASSFASALRPLAVVPGVSPASLRKCRLKLDRLEKPTS